MRIIKSAVLATTLFPAFFERAQAAKPQPKEKFLYAIANTKADNVSTKNVFIDLFEPEKIPDAKNRVKRLKAQGKNVICYFSAGTHESYRPDAAQLEGARGKKMEGWPEYWLDYRNSKVVTVMKNRISRAKEIGCDGVDPDNVDGHLNSTGFSLNANDQKKFLTTLSTHARSLGLAIGLKNSAETASKLQPLFDFVVVEECARYKECPAYKSFSENKKAIFQLEYVRKGAANNSSLCRDANNDGRTLNFANLDLTWQSPCQ